MKIGRLVVFFFFIFPLLVLGGNSNDRTTKKDIQNTKGSDQGIVEDIFQTLLNEAKTNYADALISVHFQDTAEACYLFDKTFEISSQLLQLDSLSEYQSDELDRFIEKITADFHTYKSILSNADFSVPMLREQIDTLESLQETVDIEGMKITVLSDEDGHIPIITSKKVERIIEFFSTREKRNFQEWLNRIERYRDVLMPIIRDYGLPDEIFYMAVIESGLNPRAYSWARAAGPWQFISSTASLYGLKRNWWVDERRDPIKSTHAACRYLRDLYDYFEDWFLAMAAYNAGTARIERAIRREGTRDYWKLRTLPVETRNYIPTMMAAIIIADNPEQYGFNPPQAASWGFTEVRLKGSYELEILAQCAGISPLELKSYNPELRRWSTPPDVESYLLRIPVESRDRFLREIKKAPHSAEKQWSTHRVRRGENLYTIARKYGTSVSAIVAANNIRNRNRIQIGQKLLIPADNNYKRRIYRSSSRSSSKITSVPNHRPIVYVVKKGDTLGHIAEYYNTRASKIRKWNGLRYGEYIYPGQKLTVWVPEDSEF